MAEVYDGVFATMLSVFSNDELQYYITGEKDNWAHIIECNKIRKASFVDEPTSRYQWIDKLLSQENYEDKDNMVLDFLREDLLSSKLFSKH